MSVENTGSSLSQEHIFTLPNGEALPLDVVIAMLKQKSAPVPDVERKADDQDDRTYFFPEEESVTFAPNYVPNAGMLIDHTKDQLEAKVLRDTRGRFAKKSIANAAIHFSDHPHAV